MESFWKLQSCIALASTREAVAIATFHRFSQFPLVATISIHELIALHLLSTAISNIHHSNRLRCALYPSRLAKPYSKLTG